MIDILEKKADLFLRATEAGPVAGVAFGDRLDVHNRQHNVIPMDYAGTLADNVPAVIL